MTTTTDYAPKEDVHARALRLLHDQTPVAVVVELLRQLDEERAGTYHVEYGVGVGFPWERVYPAAERAIAAAAARNGAAGLQVRIVRRGPWTPAS